MGSCYVAQASSEMEPLLSAETNCSQGSRGLERWSVSRSHSTRRSCGLTPELRLVAKLRNWRGKKSLNSKNSVSNWITIAVFWNIDSILLTEQREGELPASIAVKTPAVIPRLLQRQKLGTDKSNYSPLLFSGMPRGSPVIKSITFLRMGERN